MNKVKKIILYTMLIVMCVTVLVTVGGCRLALFSGISSLVDRDRAEVTIDGVRYYISMTSNDAAVLYFEKKSHNGELQRCVVPETVKYRKKTYPVTEVGHYSYNDYQIIKGGGQIGELVLPTSVEYVFLWHYNDVDTLTSITVESGNKRIASKDGVLFDVDKKELLYYPLGKTDETYTLPKEFTRVNNDSCFGKNKYLQNLNVEDGSSRYMSVDGVLYTADGSTLMAYPSGRKAETFTAPKAMKNIHLNSYFWTNTYITKVDSVEGGYLKAVENALYTHDGQELVFRPRSNGKAFAIPSTVKVVSYNSLPGVEYLYVPNSVAVFLDAFVPSSYSVSGIANIYFEGNVMPKYLQQYNLNGQLHFGVERDSFENMAQLQHGGTL